MASVNGVDGSSGSNTNSSSDTGLNAMDGNAFLTLLTAQLKAQDPENAQDPSQFVSQLAQFSQLEQTIQIRQILQQNLPSDSSQSSSNQSNS